MGVRYTTGPDPADRSVAIRRLFTDRKFLSRLFTFCDTPTLSTCAQVCTRWFQVCVPHRWSSLTVSEGTLESLMHRFFPDRAHRPGTVDYLPLLQNARFVRYMSWVHSLSLDWNAAGVRFFPLLFTARNVQHLTISNFDEPLEDDVLNTVVRYGFPKIRKLTLVGCSALADYNFFRLLCGVGAQLRGLELVDCDLLGDSAMSTVVENLPRLTSLAWIRTPGPRAPVPVAEECLVEVVSSMGARLTSLELRGLPATDRLLMHLAMTAPYLRHLTIQAVPPMILPTGAGMAQDVAMGISANGVNRVLERCTNLVSIEVGNLFARHGAGGTPGQLMRDGNGMSSPFEPVDQHPVRRPALRGPDSLRAPRRMSAGRMTPRLSIDIPSPTLLSVVEGHVSALR